MSQPIWLLNFKVTWINLNIWLYQRTFNPAYTNMLYITHILCLWQTNSYQWNFNSASGRLAHYRHYSNIIILPLPLAEYSLRMMPELPVPIHSDSHSLSCTSNSINQAWTISNAPYLPILHILKTTCELIARTHKRPQFKKFPKSQQNYQH